MPYHFPVITFLSGGRRRLVFSFYSRINYRLYYKKRVVLKHLVTVLCLDEDLIGDISIVTEQDVTNLILRTFS